MNDGLRWYCVGCGRHRPECSETAAAIGPCACGASGITTTIVNTASMTLNAPTLGWVTR